MRDIRHVSKLLYTMTESIFYEPIETHYKPSAEYRALVQEVIDKSTGHWHIVRNGFWFYVHAHPVNLPTQGWKIHVSSTPSNGATTLEKVARTALLNGVSFKFALDKKFLSLIGSKAWHRGGSGKFITIYPTTTSSFKNLLEQLYIELRSDVGPYVLSDKRYKDCRALYYRFGEIRGHIQTEITGEKTSVLVSPNGDVVADVRTPYFSLPSWVDDPYPDPDIELRGEITLSSGRYLVKQALAFSNTGGVYLALDRNSGADVVLKEARPNTAIDESENDAVDRLRKEFAILEVLRDTGIAPTPLEAFYDWENFFIAEEYLEGIDIRELLLTQSPLLRVSPSFDDSVSFYKSFITMFTSFLNAVIRVHERGITLGDLSAANFKIDPTTYTVRLIDFEGAFRYGIDRPTDISTPGFRNPRRRKGLQGVSDDYYSIAAIMLYTLFPISAFAGLKPDLYETALKTVLADAGWSRTRVFAVVNGLSKSTITPRDALSMLSEPVAILPPSYDDTTEAMDCDAVAHDLGRFILAHVRADGNECLFPADPFMDRTNPFGLGFGACGVLYSLKKCDFEIPEPAYEWLARELSQYSPERLAPGLLTGSSGIAWCLWELGMHDRAIDHMELANRSRIKTSHHSFLYGMAGVGMANLYFYLRTLRPEYLAAANELADSLLCSAQTSPSGMYWESDGAIQIGFGYGQSGVALFLHRLAQLTSRKDAMTAARDALDFDLSHSDESESGVISFPGTPSSPTLEQYLEQGSAGIAKVALRCGSAEKLQPMLRDAWRKYSVFPGLLYGLSSFIDVLTDASIFLQDSRYREMASRPLAGLRDIYLLKQQFGSATPGDGFFRISCDYATGVAGVMRTLYRFHHSDDSDFTLDELDTRKSSAVDGRVRLDLLKT